MCRDEEAAEGSTAASAGKGLRCSSRAGSHAQSSAGSKHRVAAATTAPSMRRFTRRTARSTSRSDTPPTQSLHASPEVALEAVAVNPRARATRVPDVASRPTRNAGRKPNPASGRPNTARGATEATSNPPPTPSRPPGSIDARRRARRAPSRRARPRTWRAGRAGGPPRTETDRPPFRRAWPRRITREIPGRNPETTVWRSTGFRPTASCEGVRAAAESAAEHRPCRPRPCDIRCQSPRQNGARGDKRAPPASLEGGRRS